MDYESILDELSEGYMSFEERQEARQYAREQVAEVIDEVMGRWAGTVDQSK